MTTVVSAAIRFPADVLVQEIELRHATQRQSRRCSKRYNLKRSVQCTLVYTFWTNPVCLASLALTRYSIAPLRTMWGALPCNILQAGLMLLICTPTNNLGYLWLYEWLKSGGDVLAANTRFRHDALQVLSNGLGFWGLVHFLNFSMVSAASFQRIFQMAAGFLWAMYLAYFTNRAIDAIPSSPNSPSSEGNTRKTPIAQDWSPTAKEPSKAELGGTASLPFCFHMFCVPALLQNHNMGTTPP